MTDTNTRLVMPFAKTIMVVIIMVSVLVLLCGCARMQITDANTRPIDVTIEPLKDVGDEQFWADIVSSPKPTITDAELIKGRYQAYCWETAPVFMLDSIMQDIEQDGNIYYFRSVDYTSERGASWPVQLHLYYLADFIRSVGPLTIRMDSDLRDTALGLLDYWLECDYICPTNWYPNDIGVPRKLAEIAMLLDENISNAQKEKIAQILDRGTLGRNDEVKNLVGANLADLIQITLMHGLITGENDLIARAKTEIENLICIQEWGNDGIQADLSFYDHYSVLVTAGSYGTVYSGNITLFITLLYGTEYAVSREKEELFIDFVLDGERFFHRNYGTTNFSTARFAVYCKGGEQILENLRRLIQLENLYRGDELILYYESYTDSSKTERSGKYFPLSGTIVSISPEAYIAVRGCQKGNSLTDVVNQQGVLNYNLSYGSNTSYMYYGDEYKSIGPSFDFAMYPGTTSWYETDDELLERYVTGYNVNWGHMPRQNTACCGLCESIGDEDICILKTAVDHEGITGNNLFIIYKGAFYAMGVDFNCSNQAKTIMTTVDQCLAGVPLSNAVLTKGSSITNRAFTYKNLCDAGLYCEFRTKLGNYRRGDIAGDDMLVSCNVFLAYFDWGTEMNDVSYAYSVKPATGCMTDAEIIRLDNNSVLQIIEFSDGVIAGYAYDKCNYTDSTGTTYSFEKDQLILKYDP